MFCSEAVRLCSAYDNESTTDHVYGCRFLTGPCQISDRLIEPEKCAFDHVHQEKQCHGFQWWSEVAHKACRGIKHMGTESFPMLLLRGTDVFTGVDCGIRVLS